MASFLFPEAFTKLQGFYLRFFIKKAIKYSDKIVTVSKSSKKDILEVFPWVDSDKVIVTPLGISSSFKKIEDERLLSDLKLRYNLASGVILFVGTIQPRKNIDILIDAFSDLKKNNKIKHKLVIIGRYGWMYKDILKRIKDLGINNDIIVVDNLPLEDLVLFYNIADIFISASSYEGFGLTVLEAMSCSTPVVTSNVSSLPEVTEGAALLIEPRNKK